MDKKDWARFWSKVDVAENDIACWEWRGRRDEDGYGGFKAEGRNLRAHRLAVEFFNGPIGDSSSVVCHKCDNPPCCNPRHLFVGSIADNWRDSKVKGRREYAEHKRRGGNSNWARLTEDQVIEIRRLHASGNITQEELAARFGVTRPNIHHVVTRKTWSHLP